MDAFRTETMIVRQLDFNRYKLPQDRRLDWAGFASPGQQKAAAADAFNVHRPAGPNGWRSDVASQFDLYPMAFPSVDLFHLTFEKVPTAKNRDNSVNSYTHVYSKVIKESEPLGVTPAAIRAGIFPGNVNGNMRILPATLVVGN
jgi:hypothetical protein